MWLYPLPSVIAFLGWAYIFLTSGWRFAGFGIVSLIAGIIAYYVWVCAELLHFETTLRLKQSAEWSFTIPTACIHA